MGRRPGGRGWRWTVGSGRRSERTAWPRKGKYSRRPNDNILRSRNKLQITLMRRRLVVGERTEVSTVKTFIEG